MSPQHPPHTPGSPPPGNHKPNESERLLSELESLNTTLDNEPYDLEAEHQLEDLPVLKSFVEDVPVLSDRIIKEEPSASMVPDDDNAASDSDPLAISEYVKQQRAAALGNTTPNPTLTDTTEASPSTPTAKPTAARSLVEQNADKAAQSKLENNPFLPQSAKDRIREHHADASEELHQLLKKPSTSASFSGRPGSPEYQQLRLRASKMIDEIVKTNLPRLEAELRMGLETEVDALFRQQNKD
ncbi:hypothetical protein A9Q99_23225 [Gammaproteobacteria bacterium 45_16_T64]|nr:hypothetical protein A9Q99_23225 [Gammaproteobacteria bacterium 45_16_T64]